MFLNKEYTEYSNLYKHQNISKTFTKKRFLNKSCKI